MQVHHKSHRDLCWKLWRQFSPRCISFFWPLWSSQESQLTSPRLNLFWPWCPADLDAMIDKVYAAHSYKLATWFQFQLQRVYPFIDWWIIAFLLSPPPKKKKLVTYCKLWIWMILTNLNQLQDAGLSLVFQHHTSNNFVNMWFFWKMCLFR